jgi:hypothetical protein
MHMLKSAAAGLRSALAEQHASPEPTAEELDDISLATDRLWHLDVNRLKPENGDYSLNLQHGKRFGDSADVAYEPLFTHVNEALIRKPSFAAFIALLVGERSRFSCLRLGHHWESKHHEYMCTLCMTASAARVRPQDNYSSATGRSEVVTAEERAENSRFLDAAMVRHSA